MESKLELRFNEDGFFWHNIPEKKVSQSFGRKADAAIAKKHNLLRWQQEYMTARKLRFSIICPEDI